MIFNKIKLISITFCFFSILGFSQELSEVLSEQLCKCYEDENATSIEKADLCFEQVLFKNYDSLLNYYSVDSLDEINFDKLSAEIAVYLTKNCSYMNENFRNPENSFEDDFIPKENLNCNDFKNGDNKNI